MDESALLLNQLFRAHHNACMAALAQRGVGDVGSPRLLLQLAQYPDGPEGAPTQKELADKLHNAPATIAASLKVLERQGYVTRRVDQADSRRNRIFITPKGRDTVEASFQAFQQVDDHMYHGFTQEELVQVYQFHQRMLENLYQIGGRRQGEFFPPCPPGTPPNPPERKCDPC